MSNDDEIDYKSERTKDLDAIVKSKHPKRVVVAGPGTGKSYLLQKAIEEKQKDGKTEFLAITFIGKLGDALADDLAGLAKTTTMHSFARELVLQDRPKDWVYYPKIKDVIKEDLNIKGITEFEIGDENYEERSNYYKAVGEADIVYYAVKMCKEDGSKIPSRDLILIDEFQDFNEIEDEFITLLAKKNEILIVGDDDQALYKFKMSDPKFIRNKHDSSNTEFESHTLRWCSRCPEAVVKSFHNVVDHYKTELTGRINKDYLCYVPDKEKDSKLNPKINVMQAQVGQIAMKIKKELDGMLKSQSIKSVLVIGEGRTCKSTLATVARLMSEYGFKNVQYSNMEESTFQLKHHVIDGYKALLRQKNEAVAWRLISIELDDKVRTDLISKNYSDTPNFIAGLPDDFKKKHEANAKALVGILEKTNSARKQISDSTITKLSEELVIKKKEERELFIDQLVHESKFLDRPLANLDITVCNILGSKGLGADVVFLIGFDKHKLPAKDKVDDSEIYQMLVALTRTKKRIYLVNTKGCEVSSFINAIDKDNYQVIS